MRGVIFALLMALLLVGFLFNPLFYPGACRWRGMRVGATPSVADAPARRRQNKRASCEALL